MLGTPLDKTYPTKNRDLQNSSSESTWPCRSLLPVRRPADTASRFATARWHSSREAIRLGRQVFLAKSLFDNRELKFPWELERYGAEVLENETSVEMLCGELPRSRGEPSAEVPF